MIRLTRFDGTSFVLNCEVIQYVEAAPDTIVTLTTKEKLIVKESVEEIVELVIGFKQRVFQGILEFKRDPDEETRE